MYDRHGFHRDEQLFAPELVKRFCKIIFSSPHPVMPVNSLTTSSVSHAITVLEQQYATVTKVFLALLVAVYISMHMDSSFFGWPAAVLIGQQRQSRGIAQPDEARSDATCPRPAGNLQFPLMPTQSAQHNTRNSPPVHHNTMTQEMKVSPRATFSSVTYVMCTP